MTFHDWLAMRSEGMWLADKNAEPGMSNIDPLEQAKVKNKKRKAKAMPKVKVVKAAVLGPR